MELYEQQYVNVLLATAVERFSERIVQRNEGVRHALERLRDNPQGEGLWLDDFVEAFFRDALLDNPAGASLILQAFANRNVPDLPRLSACETVGDMLREMATQTFSALLRQKTEEALEQALAFGG